MRQRIIINCTPQEARVALLENDSLAEIHIERAQQRSIAGNIYKGKVARVLPGMQAAFVDIGLEKAGFIHVSDLFGGPLPSGLFEEDEEHDLASPEDGAEEDHPEEDPAALGETTAPPGGRGRRERFTPHIPLEERLKKNQEILVQITKEPIGTKGSRLTSHISLPGRHLVYTPTVNHIGVSRRIADGKERKRLRDIVQELRPPQGGFIVRTACEGLTKKEMQDDMKFLLKLWGGIAAKSETVSAPALLHDDMDVTLRIIRDLFTADVQEVVIDTPQDYERVKEFVATFLPRLTNRIKLHDRPEPIFDYYNIEAQITKALDRRVYLKSGGHIVIDHTEALTAIDVNTGRFVGKRDQEETMLQTNLEAAKVVVEQLRLRNIGGLIIIDFIDMERAANRNKVTEALREALKKDKTRSSMRKISELGLVQMTRKRTRESLQRQLCDPCSYCEGKGYIRSVPTVAGDILRQLRKETYLHPGARHITVKAHPEVITFLYDEEGERLDELERQLRKRIFLRATPGFHHEQYEVGVDLSPQNSAPPRETKSQEPAPPARQRATAGAGGRQQAAR
ncbi:MAG TPA: Rne/Rng family ribonuclease [Candidatus Binatia bacterium]|nr:Rne/Rng family ribonuclease [Candidatus Binatia bacterium]